jgi:hypothetical protein
MREPPPQQHCRDMTPFVSAPSVAARIFDHSDPRVEKARRHARLRRRARKNGSSLAR